MALRGRCERHTFWQWREVRYHGNGIWQKIRRKIVDRIPSIFLKHFKWNFAHVLALRCRHTFWKWKVNYHGNGILWQEIIGEKLCRAFLMEFSTHRNSVIPQTCTFGGDIHVYYALRNYWFTCYFCSVTVTHDKLTEPNHSNCSIPVKLRCGVTYIIISYVYYGSK